MAYNFASTDIKIYKAALHDDWESVSEMLDENPELLTKPINDKLMTPLYIAVGTNRSNHFVEKLVERLVAVGIATDKIFSGSNPLHIAAAVGNTAAARLLVELNPSITTVGAPSPVAFAAAYGNKETLRYLLTVTPDLEEGTSSPYTGVAGGNLIILTLMAGFYDVALEIINNHPNIVLQRDVEGRTAMDALARKPEQYLSGSNLGFWGRLIYSLIKTQEASKVNVLSSPIFNKFAAGIWKGLHYIAPRIKKIHDIKIKHDQINLLVQHTCKTAIENFNDGITRKILGNAIFRAVTYGTHELIEESILTYPDIIWYDDGGYDDGGFNLCNEAIKQRQERVYNLLVYQVSSHIVILTSQFTSQFDGSNGDNALHIAAKLAPSHRLNVVTGAALQMQRELQWFKEVENFVIPSFKEALNNDKKTPRMVFTDAHKDLLKDGQQWMKDTSSSCTVVAALIVTITFAAVFTVPGGISEDGGKPLFLNDSVFMLFMVSDAIALFSASTSVLMFLGILTSRYAEDDFLYALPKRLAIGLISLFLSLAATLITFSATVALVLRDKVTWIAASLVIATSIPVCLFGLLQFPLLVELVYSTYGPSIFHKQSDRMIY